MFRFNKIGLSKPTVAYFIAMIVGSLDFVLFKINFFMGFIFCIIFILIVIKTIEIRFSIIITLFFLFSFLNIMEYFNFNLNNDGIYKIRVEKNYGYFATGSYFGRKISLIGDMKSIKEGCSYYIKGEYKNKIEIESGTVGELSISENKKCQYDALYYLTLFKKNVSNKFINLLGTDKGSIVLSLCFGETDDLSNISKENFKNLGIIHAISVSGFHIAMVFKIIAIVFGSNFGILISFIYVIFTGFSEVTLRAFIMIFVLVFSKKVIKNYDGLSSLCFSGMILLAFKPYDIFSLGFSLSFIATFSIIVFYKILIRKFYYLPLKLNESISMSLSSMVITLPYLLMVFNNFTLMFIVGNFLVIPIYTLIVILGNFALVFIWFDSIFNIINYLIYYIMTTCEGVVYFLLKISPPMIYGGSLHGILLMGVFFSYLLYKRGFTIYKYMPLIFCVIIMVNNYNFFKTIEYVKYKNDYGFVIRDNGYDVFISNFKIKNLKEKESFSNYFRTDKFLDFGEIENGYKINDDIYLKKAYKNNGKLSIIIVVKNKEYYIRGGEEVVKYEKEKYNLVDLPKSFDGEKAYTPVKLLSLKFIFGETFILF